MSRTSIKTRATELRQLVLATLEAAGVVGIDILTAPVTDYRELVWLAPGIYPDLEVAEDIPTMFKLGALTARSNKALQAAYNKTLSLFSESPLAALSDDRSYMEYAAHAFYLEGPVSRAIFSVPAIEGDMISEEASYTFAMEFAAACMAANVGHMYRGPDDFFIVDDDLAVGIRNGKVIGFEEVFDVDISSYVEAYLTMPRGSGWKSDTFDILDRLQFWVETAVIDNPALEPITYLLPYLRACPENGELARLEKAIYRLNGAARSAVDEFKVEKLNAEAYFRALDDATAVMLDIRTPDSDKVNALMSLLVPHVVAEGTFLKGWYSFRDGIITLSKRQQDKILNNLNKLRNKPLKRYKRNV